MIKKTIIGVCILAALVLLFPFRGHLKDGGSVEYRTALYCVTDVHRLIGNTDPEHEYIDGIFVEILGIEVFNNID